MPLTSTPASPSVLDPDVIDRALGAVVGLAVGDALGATLEFAPVDPRRFHSEMLGGGPFGVRPGEWTDDTAMTLALADSLLSPSGFTPDDFMTRLADWLQHGRYSCQGYCVDVDRSTFTSICRFLGTNDPLSHTGDEVGTGKGSIVRLAPVAVYHLYDPEKAVRVARLQCACTHPAPEAADAAAFVIMMLRGLILGLPDGAAPLQLQPLEQPRVRGIAADSYLSFPQRQPTLRTSDPLENALWALHHTEGFEQALITATSLGGEAESVGAVTGMLAGATYGLSAIPSRWLRPLAWRDTIVGTSQQLLPTSVSYPARPVHKQAQAMTHGSGAAAALAGHGQR